MSLPTLLVPGGLRLARGSADADSSKLTPLAYIQNWVRRRMPEFGGQGGALADRILIVRAETGSGKSTALPVGLFRLLRAETAPARQRYRGPGVICTQPRVLTAISLAQSVSSGRNRDIVLGETVGFQTGPARSEGSTGLTYATAGVLAVQLRMMTDGEMLDRYRFIIVDEAHERSLDSDMILMLLRYFYMRNAGDPRLPFLLLTSATIEPGRYAEYFGVGRENVIEVVGRSYPITTHWPAHACRDYTKAAASLAIQIHQRNSGDSPDQADILIFIPGLAESLAVVAGLVRLQRDLEGDIEGDREGAAPFLILQINREVVIEQSEDYRLLFAPVAKLPRIRGRAPSRRIIVSTVVAETGITIDSLKYVIECGWSRTVETYQPWGVTGLITRPAPQSRIHQRRGRVGRLFPGEFFPLYTEAVYDALDKMQLPDIFISGGADIFLSMVAAQQRQKQAQGQLPEFRVEDMAMLDPPPVEALLRSIQLATALGFLSPRAPLPPPVTVETPVVTAARAHKEDRARATETAVYGLTPLGFLAAAFARTPMVGIRILLAGYTWGVAASDLITAVAMFGLTMSDLIRRGPSSDKALPAGASALCAALPPYLRTDTSGHLSASTAAFYRARLLLADDFAEVVLVFDAFMTQLDAAAGDICSVAEWCSALDLNLNGLLLVARRRDQIAEEMIIAGLDPFRLAPSRLSAAAVEQFTPALRRFKRCIFDGLQQNLLRFDAAARGGPGYVLHLHGDSSPRIKAPQLYTDAMADRLADSLVTGGAPARPRWAVTDQVRIVQAPKRTEDAGMPLLYTLESNLVCVLDGYVDFDPDSGMPREFI